MTIKAILRDGAIQPVEPLPSQWADGQELIVEQPEFTAEQSELRAWTEDLESAAAKLPPEEHERFLKALDEIERQSKNAVGREWG
jgi:hypothetical protein